VLPAALEVALTPLLDSLVEPAVLGEAPVRSLDSSEVLVRQELERCG
jgi:hypothetical protein